MASYTNVSPLPMAQTGETIPAEKHVRIKFHQTGPSKRVNFTPAVSMLGQKVSKSILALHG